MRVPIPRPLRFAVLALAAALLLAACGSSNDSSSTTASSTADTTASTAGDGGSSSGGTIGFSIPQGADPSLQLLAGGLKAEAAKSGLQTQVTDANLDVNKQIADLDTMTQQKVKAIVVWPLDSKAVQPALDRARAANIPIVAIYALSGGPYFTDIILDGHGIGRSGAEYMAKTLGKGAKVAAIFGPPQVDQFREIAEGFKAGATASGLDLVESQVDAKLSPESSATLTQDFKQRYGSDLKGLFSTLESGALASSAVTGGDFTPAITTYGATDNALKGLADGSLSGVVYQNTVLMGRIAGWAATQAVAAAKLPAKIFLEPGVLTKETVTNFPDTAEQLTKPYDFKPVQENGRWTMPLFK
jgi:ABC-type sugar transport system substrate-binding protein